MKQYLSILVLFLFSCVDQEPQNEYKAYIESKVPKDLLGQMPEHIEIRDFKLAMNLTPQNGQYTANPVHVYLSYKSTNIDSVYDQVEKMTQASYKYEDTCNVVIHKFQKGMMRSSAYGREWLYENWVEKLKKCDVQKFPIPNFIGVDNDPKKAGLSKTFDLFVLEAEKGIHFPDKYYAEPLIMPEGWEHGHSKGYALSREKNQVIFWFIIW